MESIEPFIGVIGTIAGVFIGGVITILTQNYRNKHERTLSIGKRQLEKLEEAHQLLTAISYRYRGYYAYDIIFEFLEIENKKAEEGIIPFERLEMLISFYVPELLEDVTGLIIQCQEYGSLSRKVRTAASKNNSEKEALSEEINLKYTALESKFSELKANISNHAQTHAS